MGREEGVRFDIPGEKLAQDRTNYYDRWHKFAAEEVSRAKEEEEKEKSEADKILGLDKNTPKSEAEKEDREKLEALKEAKKKWDQKQLGEASMKFALENFDSVSKKLDSVKLHWKPVIIFKNNKNATFTIPKDLKHKLIKIFVENCDDCEFHFESGLITQHIEIAHCNNCKIFVKESLATLQIDLSKNVHIFYSKGLFIEKKVKIFHAGVEKLTIELENEDDNDIHRTCFLEEITDDDKLPNEVQFLTHMLDGKLITERVIRDKGNLPSTEKEIKENMLQPKSYVREAELKKIGGNEAFKEKNYAQAAIFYTEAVDSLEKAGLERLTTEESEMLAVLYQNRAFCWQKLGHHDKAEEDAKQAVNIKPDYAKGLFRLGLALHAQKKYFEAAPILGKALKLEPKNEQIKQALGFAEIQMRKLMQQKD